MTDLIRVEGVTKNYSLGKEKFEVLKGLDFRVEKGSFVVIMGKSGSGKTTFLNLLGLLDKFDGGKYIYNGTDVTGMSDNQRSDFRNKNLGFIFQQFHLIESLNIGQNIELPLLYSGVSDKNKRVKAVKEALSKVGLLEKIRNFPNQLSGGQQQRISIARALVNNPDIILADEPTGALDSKTGYEIVELLADLNRQGKTVIMVTHDEDLKRYASHLVFLKDGVFIREEEM
ncbi:putative ABC transport system ATP-binding protein [Clostridium cavendishii DSM 21758]|uniref:Putative ABC transport system ATP-binding protein n=1 Tax=Clostridium cavendishii DSM 21758 TaxID=1121302 RepID=A0A1M6ECY3_9CLOT|nr:ABC transporter ATP-binding protein [Clostridium cavendishii]SHI83301.1 putative ABC transport system ATP-binding protein [Clostridium cavendishii DSM 21758]